MLKMRGKMTQEKDIILSVFNTLKYMDNNIANIIDDYIYETHPACIFIGISMPQTTLRYGKRHGKSIQFFQKDVTLTSKIEKISDWKNGVLDGQSIEWWYNGQLSSIVMYKEGLKEGYEIEFHEDGTTWATTTYKKGLIEGESKQFWENGNIRYQYFSKEGKSQGEYKEWTEDGKLIDHLEFKDGLKVKDYLK